MISKGFFRCDREISNDPHLAQPLASIKVGNTAILLLTIFAQDRTILTTESAEECHCL